APWSEPAASAWSSVAVGHTQASGDGAEEDVADLVRVVGDEGRTARGRRDRLQLGLLGLVAEGDDEEADRALWVEPVLEGLHQLLVADVAAAVVDPGGQHDDAVDLVLVVVVLDLVEGVEHVVVQTRLPALDLDGLCDLRELLAAGDVGVV